jgi:hypothetical protein
MYALAKGDEFSLTGISLIPSERHFHPSERLAMSLLPLLSDSSSVTVFERRPIHSARTLLSHFLRNTGGLKVPSMDD